MEKFNLENILTLTKSLSTLYINGVIESSNENVRKVLDAGLRENLVLQDELYQQMSNDGFYTVENLTESAINKVLKKLTKDTSN